VWLAAWAATTPNVKAQHEPALSIRPYAGLTIVGDVGTVCSIEYVTDLADPAGNGWRSLEYLQLPASPHLWVDTSTPVTGTRDDRVVAMEPPENMVFIPPGTFRMGPFEPLGELERPAS
jgi:hypothetical protein